MGTPAIIEIEGVDYAKIIKNKDGHPKYTLKWLEKFNKDFVEERGDFNQSVSAKFAQLLRATVENVEKMIYYGWEVVPYHNNNGVYRYILHTDGSVSIR